MKRYFIRLAYVGTNYHGWQIQENAQNTVQAMINDALSKVLGENIEVTGAGRTDTGVHAKEFYAHFDSKQDSLATDHFTYPFKFNQLLPKDIVIKKIYQVTADAHARFDARSRSYEYWIKQFKDPFLNDRVYFMFDFLDVNEMNKGADMLMERHDFACFCKSGAASKTTICKVMDAKWEHQGSLLVFRVTADRFLRNMVRAMVGTLLDLGRGKINLKEFEGILNSGERSQAGTSVPANGLYLTDITYPSNVFMID